MKRQIEHDIAALDEGGAHSFFCQRRPQIGQNAALPTRVTVQLYPVLGVERLRAYPKGV